MLRNVTEILDFFLNKKAINKKYCCFLSLSFDIRREGTIFPRKLYVYLCVCVCLCALREYHKSSICVFAINLYPLQRGWNHWTVTSSQSITDTWSDRHWNMSKSRLYSFRAFIYKYGSVIADSLLNLSRIKISFLF